MEFKDGYKKMDLKMDMKLCSMIEGWIEFIKLTRKRKTNQVFS